MDSKPDFINPQGVKWWGHVELTARAQKLLGPEYTSWVVETPEGVRSYVTINNKEAVHSTQSLEAAGLWMEVCKFAKGEK